MWTICQSWPGCWGSLVVLPFLMVDTCLACPFFSSVTMWEADMLTGLQNSTDRAWIWFCHLPDGGPQMSWFNPLHSVFSLVKESIWMIPRVGIRIKHKVLFTKPSTKESKCYWWLYLFFFLLKIFKEWICFHWKRIESYFAKPPLPTHHHCKSETWLDFENPCPTFTLSPCGMLKERHN